MPDHLFPLEKKKKQPKKKKKQKKPKETKNFPSNQTPGPLRAKKETELISNPSEKEAVCLQVGLVGDGVYSREHDGLLVSFQGAPKCDLLD